MTRLSRYALRLLILSEMRDLVEASSQLTAILRDALRLSQGVINAITRKTAVLREQSLAMDEEGLMSSLRYLEIHEEHIALIPIERVMWGSEEYYAEEHLPLSMKINDPDFLDHLEEATAEFGHDGISIDHLSEIYDNYAENNDIDDRFIDVIALPDNEFMSGILELWMIDSGFANALADESDTHLPRVETEPEPEERGEGHSRYKVQIRVQTGPTTTYRIVDTQNMSDRWKLKDVPLGNVWQPLGPSSVGTITVIGREPGGKRNETVSTGGRTRVVTYSDLLAQDGEGREFPLEML